MPNLRLGRRSIHTQTTFFPNRSSDQNLLLRNLRSQKVCKEKESLRTEKALSLEVGEAVSVAEVAVVVVEGFLEEASVVVHEEALVDEAEVAAAINNK